MIRCRFTGRGHHEREPPPERYCVIRSTSESGLLARDGWRDRDGSGRAPTVIGGPAVLVAVAIGVTRARRLVTVDDVGGLAVRRDRDGIGIVSDRDRRAGVLVAVSIGITVP